MLDHTPPATTTPNPEAKLTAHLSPKRIKKGAYFLSLVTTFLVAVVPASARDNIGMERLALCQDSWIDWQKSSPAELKKLADALQSGFTHKEQDPFFVPKSAETILGLPVAQVFPESIGMAVGFSVMVRANFQTVSKLRAWGRSKGTQFNPGEGYADRSA